MSTEAQSPLQIQIVSDLHIELYDEWKDLDFLIEPQAPILALLGDIGYACTHQLRDFLHSQCDRFEKVLLLAGNHEYYNQRGTVYSMIEQLNWLRKVSSERPNLHFMEKESIILNGVTVLGTTLWSNIPKNRLKMAENSMNDYNLSYNHGPGESIRKLKAKETHAMYQESIYWLESELQKAKKKDHKVVVLTHHTPMLTGTSDPRHKDSDLTCCFSSDLKNFLIESSPNLVVWACGHTHYNFDFMVGDVRLVSNQRGYKMNPKSEYKEEGVVLQVYAFEIAATKEKASPATLSQSIGNLRYDQQIRWILGVIFVVYLFWNCILKVYYPVQCSWVKRKKIKRSS